jgi:small subunit ribosomal protein S8
LWGIAFSFFACFEGWRVANKTSSFGANALLCNILPLSTLWRFCLRHKVERFLQSLCYSMFIHNFCSHLTNSSKKNMKLIKVPKTKSVLEISRILYSHGFIQSLTQIPSPEISKNQIQIDLKYRHGTRVLTQLKTISKPSRRIFCSVDELRLVALGKNRNLVGGQNVGDVIILNTPFGIIDMNEALLKGVGGEVLCIAK